MVESSLLNALDLTLGEVEVLRYVLPRSRDRGAAKQETVLE
jgi:hypothetical protein